MVSIAGYKYHTNGHAWLTCLAASSEADNLSCKIATSQAEIFFTNVSIGGP